MYLTVKQQVKHLSKDEYEILRDLCHTAKNLANEALYNIRQYFFAEGKYLSYVNNYKLLKSSPNYKKLNSNMAQQILKEVDGSFSSFFELLKMVKVGEYDADKCHIPHYLPKDGYTTLVIGFVRIKDNCLVLPYSQSYKKDHEPVKIKMPPILKDKTVKEIRIVPRSDARYFEIHYSYEAVCTRRELNKNNALALDLGINNLVTAVSNSGRTFIIDGRRLKSINQWYNKQNSQIQSVKDRLGIEKNTARQTAITQKRNNRVNDYMAKTARYITDYCIKNNIGTLILGYNTDFQSNTNMGRKNNQTFKNIPYGKLRDKLKYLCELNGIAFVEQEESYTSKASFWDGDYIPVYGVDGADKCTFSGKRIHRGLYRTADGRTLNADVNGALNIMRKSSVVDLSVLYGRGGVDTPMRIRVA